jgi:hypothetical protein
VATLAVDLPCTLNIDQQRDWFEVRWTHASSEPTEMVKGEAIRDGPDLGFVGVTVSEISDAVDLDLTVLLARREDELPAAIRMSDHTAPEAFPFTSHGPG